MTNLKCVLIKKLASCFKQETISCCSTHFQCKERFLSPSNPLTRHPILSTNPKFAYRWKNRRDLEIDHCLSAFKRGNISFFYGFLEYVTQ